VNEIATIKAHGGKIILVKRGELPTQKEMQQRGAHKSEWDWIGSEFDYVIENNGTKEDLYKNIDNLVVSLEITNTPTKSTHTA
jgi:dephospho-CoA kinase